MNRRTVTPRHAATASLALAAALTLAACGGDDTIAPSPDDDTTTTEPAEPSEDEPTDDDTDEAPSDDADDDAAEEPGDDGADDGTDEAPSDDADDDAAEQPGDDDADDGAAASGEFPQVEVSWPSEWVDMSDQVPAQPGLEVQVHGEPNPDGFSMNGVVTTYPAGTAPEGATYGDLLVEELGGDSGQLAEVGEREIDGHTAMGYQQDASEAGETFRQRLYGVVLEDGSIVEFVLSAEVDQITEGMELFETVLDSAVIG
ncbi:hypothetical protein [Georgenia sp. Z1491]|uniref:hypothetical protein n=1 Tax=Georgenia sp. Z1491 TaxID=3416707 RepID=UPI003CFA7DE5